MVVLFLSVVIVKLFSSDSNKIVLSLTLSIKLATILAGTATTPSLITLVGTATSTPKSRLVALIFNEPFFTSKRTQAKIGKVRFLPATRTILFNPQDNFSLIHSIFILLRYY